MSDYAQRRKEIIIPMFQGIIEEALIFDDETSAWSYYYTYIYEHYEEDAEKDGSDPVDDYNSLVENGMPEYDILYVEGEFC